MPAPYNGGRLVFRVANDTEDKDSRQSQIRSPTTGGVSLQPQPVTTMVLMTSSWQCSAIHTKWPDELSPIERCTFQIIGN